MTFEIFLFFYGKQVFTFHANCPSGEMYMKCQILLSGKNKENIVNLSSAELAKSGKG